MIINRTGKMRQTVDGRQCEQSKTQEERNNDAKPKNHSLIVFHKRSPVRLLSIRGRMRLKYGFVNTFKIVL